ncbi:Inositol-1-monophosphatase [Planctomycetes bacterium Pla86]|uniref:Inositol-1-monophosphatase n=2 Tax=Engelhardtia mirabilis TaxID=2528011 RepID=A0A518BKH0_9BACT|nr:Inositol-1-monophosphatase [Planctomycetes bacterium Pla133]QDV01791.1 Inositol-1-monophosphatase [Planctomycetes bacterium Pla86]
MGRLGPDLTTPEGRLEVAHAAAEFAREAGALQLARLGQLRAGEVRSKSARRDLVTEVDLECERLLVERLREHFPGHAIEAEEEVRDARDEERPRWFVDPLDGTVNFIHELPAFAVSMGLFVGRRPLAAVVHAPRLAETFVAAEGAGATLNGQRIRVSDTTELADAIVATGFPYRRNELPNNNLSNFDRLFLEVRGLRRMGSAAIDLAYTAAGRIDAYWELHLGPHDMAAGALLVREAGGLVTDVDGGDDWLRSGAVVAGPESLHRALVALVEG